MDEIDDDEDDEGCAPSLREGDYAGVSPGVKFLVNSTSAVDEKELQADGSPVRLVIMLELDFVLSRGMEEILGAGVANDVSNAVVSRQDEILVLRDSSATRFYC